MMHLLAPIGSLAPESPWLLPLFFALLGACIGSFLNVVIYRLPRNLSINEPRRSFCPTCKAPIPWYLNLPLISWLMLRGRSACCRQPIAARYWLVEAACALIWGALAYGYETECAPVVLLLCIWCSLMLATFCIDWECMIVLPVLTVSAACCGICVSYFSPWLIGENCLEAWDGLRASLIGGAGAFLLFKLVAYCGKLCFGHKQRRYAQPCPWSMAQDEQGTDIDLRIGEETHKWSELFPEEDARLTLRHATEHKHQPQAADALCFDAEALLLPDGTRIPLESVESLSGSCRGYELSRAAMGSGDAWIAMAIGCLCGWQGAVFALVGGSFIGLAMAAVNRIGIGKPMPFGPALIAAAAIHLFWGEALGNLYYSLWGL